MQLSTETVENIRFVCALIISPVLCVIGFLANVINTLILTRSWMSCSTNVYLTAVAVCDSLFIVNTAILLLWYGAGWKRNPVFAYPIPYINSSATYFSNTATWLTLFFTVERYIAVSLPMFGRRMCTQKRARYAVIAIVLTSFVISFPDYLKDEMAKPENGTDYEIVATKIKPYLNYFGYTYIIQILFVFAPMILLLVFNSLLIRSVVRANRSRKELTKQSSAASDRSVNRTTASIQRDSLTMKRPDEGQNDLNSIGNSPDVANAIEANIKTSFDITLELSTNARKLTQSRNPKVQIRKPILGEQQRITLMLIGIVLAFIVLQAPSTLSPILENLKKAELVDSGFFSGSNNFVLGSISNVLLLVNASMNFVFYSLFSAKFRQTFCMLFRSYVLHQTNQTTGQQQQRVCRSVHVLK